MGINKIDNLIKKYIDENNDTTSNMANMCAILFNNLDNINWVGFYLANEVENTLCLGPFQGIPAIAKINYRSGVCGACATTRKIVVVEDVHCFEGHIACDLRSKSEMVLPILNGDGSLYAVLDIDSPIKNRFSNEEREFLGKIVEFFEKII